MTEPVVSRRLQQFLMRYVDSVEQCEILVALERSQGRWWTSDDLAGELYLSGGPTGHDLESLAARGLLDVRTVGHLLYRLAPASNDLTLAVSELSRAYRASRVDILSFIVKRKGRSVQHFADAFNFRKPD